MPVAEKELQTIRLLSSEMINTPGLLRWAMNGYKCKTDRKHMVRTFMDGYGLTEKAANDLLSGRTPHRIVGDVVEFDYPEGEARVESRTVTA